MRRAHAIGLLFLMTPSLAWAGAFTKLSAKGGVVLPTLGLKTVVAEYLYPGDSEASGVGRSMAELLGSELLDAIRDQSGAGVIVARDEGDTHVLRELESRYHEAAVDLARYHKAGFAAWGVVGGDGTSLFVDSYLTLIPEVAKGQLRLSLESEGRAVEALEADIPARFFHFAGQTLDARTAFRRRLTLRDGASTRQSPDATAAIAQQLPAGTTVAAVDLRRGWWTIVTPDGRKAYLQHDLNAVHVLPLAVVAHRLRVPPPTGGPLAPPTLARVLDGRYEVLEERYATGKGLSYRLRSTTAPIRDVGWVPAGPLERVYALRPVHFLAGLYRYQGKRYADAIREFEQFLGGAGDDEDNVTLATAHQLIGASRTNAEPSSPRALEDFSQAIALTPQDPSAYSLRALASVAVASAVRPQVFGDLNQALLLEPDNRSARNLVRGMKGIQRTPGGNTFLINSSLNERETAYRLDSLVTRFSFGRPDTVGKN